MALNFSTMHLDSIQAMNVENAHTLPAFMYSEETFEHDHYKPHFPKSGYVLLLPR
ncbi:MAG: hypothetical protein ACJATP_002217 [Candidatus Azotimanducaceae bacterium]|jgi:hypothetical protein